MRFSALVYSLFPLTIALILIIYLLVKDQPRGVAASSNSLLTKLGLALFVATSFTDGYLSPVPLPLALLLYVLSGILILAGFRLPSPPFTHL